MSLKEIALTTWTLADFHSASFLRSSLSFWRRACPTFYNRKRVRLSRNYLPSLCQLLSIQRHAIGVLFSFWLLPCGWRMILEVTSLFWRLIASTVSSRAFHSCFCQLLQRHFLCRRDAPLRVLLTTNSSVLLFWCEFRLIPWPWLFIILKLRLIFIAQMLEHLEKHNQASFISPQKDQRVVKT